jgi:alkylated DNA nucleotide flippase Atl1
VPAPIKKSWREKLADDKNLPKITPAMGKMAAKWGEGMMVVPAPREVDDMMRQVPNGKLTTISEIRDALAERHGADFCCPLTAGIFAWIAAHASAESEAEGIAAPTPYWRTLKTGGEINPKYPGGTEAVKKLLTGEGHRVAAKGKKHIVPDFEKRLFRPNPRSGQR